jgi:hypothetical protein
MISEDFIRVSPLKILECSSQGGLGRGNLGVFIARAGVGKTACLIHIALDKLFKKGKLIHVSVGEGPEKITAYYSAILNDLRKALNIAASNEEQLIVERNRMILAYRSSSFSVAMLEKSIHNMIEFTDFKPDTIIVDGLDFEKLERPFFTDIKKLASKYQAEIWFSALCHRHITEKNERGIPYPCDRLEDMFNVIIHLDPTNQGVFLRLLKDHDNTKVPDTSIQLDPTTFLLAG